MTISKKLAEEIECCTLDARDPVDLGGQPFIDKPVADRKPGPLLKKADACLKCRRRKREPEKTQCSMCIAASDD